ncbi:MAG: histidine kinase [Acidimicrobiaceae bacterium]|nr:histidine kinase [Acidimicrobiaceae bacterium]
MAARPGDDVPVFVVAEGSDRANLLQVWERFARVTPITGCFARFAQHPEPAAGALGYGVGRVRHGLDRRPVQEFGGEIQSAPQEKVATPVRGVPSVRRVIRRRSLSAQILAIQTAVLVLTLVAGFVLAVWYQEGQLDHQYEQRALGVAETVASTSSLANAVSAGDPHGVVQAMAEKIWRATGVNFVVVTNAQGIRYSHPNPLLVGKPVGDDPEPASSEPYRTGRTWVGMQTGTLGPTARGKAPIFGPGHRLIGEVSVGIPAAQVQDYLVSEIPSIAAYMLAALALGAALSLLLTRSLKRQTLGLELDAIAGLFQEREAMLHGIREGVLGLDTHNRVLLANDEARSLLRLPPDYLGRPLTDLLPRGRLIDVITGRQEGPDLLIVVEHRVVVANRMPIRAQHRGRLGWVVTFQDRTEPEGLMRELDAVLGLTEALRAQSHEFSNRLHTLVGLVELGRYEEAIAFVTDVSTARNELAEFLLKALVDPMVVALLLAKTSVALERGVELRVASDQRFEGDLVESGDLLTVLGNLIDNAVDAAVLSDGRRSVEVEFIAFGPDLLVRVSDSGPGILEADRETIFVDGWSTKQSRSGARRGLGLALVRQIVERRGGFIEVGQGEGAVFSVLLPGYIRVAAGVPQ